MEDKIFEFYCPIVDRFGKSSTTGKTTIEMFNIFDNYYVYKYTLKEVKKYLRAPSKYKYKSFSSEETLYGFDALCKELSSILAHEFWSRYQYEFSIGEPFPIGDDNKLRSELYKKDIYWLLKPNIPVIANSCINQYKKWLKTKNLED